ncbi:MAG: DUF6356 family protein [Thalassobaculaceae bacterium]
MPSYPAMSGLIRRYPALLSKQLTVHSGFGFRMILGGLACLVHGLLPFLFTKTGSRVITDLHGRMVTHRSRPAPQAGRGGQTA